MSSMANNAANRAKRKWQNSESSDDESSAWIDTYSDEFLAETIASVSASYLPQNDCC
jgi:hypothetical protein